MKHTVAETPVAGRGRPRSDAVIVARTRRRKPSTTHLAPTLALPAAAQEAITDDKNQSFGDVTFGEPTFQEGPMKEVEAWLDCIARSAIGLD